MKAHKKLTSAGHGMGVSFASTKFDVLSGSVIHEYREMASKNLLRQSRVLE